MAEKRSPRIDSETVVAVVRLAVALVVSVFAMLGVDIDGAPIENAALAAASVGVLAWVWWKNNNVTKAAQEAQEVLDEIKRGNAKVGGTDAD